MSDRNNIKTQNDTAIETLLSQVRTDGPYQWKLILLFMVPLSFTYSIAERNGIILFSTPNHVCHVPGREQSNLTVEEWHNLTIPWGLTTKGEIKQEQCLMYDQISENVSANIIFSNNETVDCEDGWDYDKSSWTETPVSKFNLVCDDASSVKLLFLSQIIGMTVGSLFFSILSDKLGRKPTFYIVLVINVVFGVSVTFSTSYRTMWFLEFTACLAYLVLCQTPYIIVQELCSQKLRYYTTFFILTAFVFATAFDSIMAWVLGDWKLFLYVTHLPSAIFILYWKFIPESPRWLLSQGKLKECEKVLTDIAEANGKKFTLDMKQLLQKAQEEEKVKKLPMNKVFTSAVLTKHLFLVSVILSCTYIIAGGINMNVHMMQGNVLMNYFILRSFELPGNIVGYFTAANLGRKLTTILNMLLASLCVLLAAFFVTDQWGLLILCGLSKTFCKGAIYTIYLYLGELFPTSLRASAYGIAQVVAIGSVICDPSIIYMGISNAQLPYFIWFGVGLFAVVLATFLPETLDQPLPQTIQEAMQIGKNQPYFSIIHKWNIHNYKSSKVTDEAHMVDLIKGSEK